MSKKHPGSENLMAPWKKGESGNKNGRPKIRDDLKDVRLLSKTEVRRLVQKILDMTPDDLMAMSEDKTVPMLEMMLASVAYKALKDGDQSKINFLLERTIGKVAEKHEHEMVDVTYETEVRGDGTLLQKIHKEELGDSEDDKG